MGVCVESVTVTLFEIEQVAVVEAEAATFGINLKRISFLGRVRKIDEHSVIISLGAISWISKFVSSSQTIVFISLNASWYPAHILWPKPKGA